MADAPQFEEPLCAQGLDHLFYEPEDDEYLFGVPDDELTIAQREAQARRICGACRHTVECALYALENEDYGVWGGLSQSDRKALGGRGFSSGWRVDYALKRMAKALPEEVVSEILELWRAKQKSNEGEVA